MSFTYPANSTVRHAYVYFCDNVWLLGVEENLLIVLCCQYFFFTYINCSAGCICVQIQCIVFFNHVNNAGRRKHLVSSFDVKNKYNELKHIGSNI